jgi:hypothetical protein
MFFFVTFKSPLPGEAHTFREGEPYAQIIVVPEGPEWEMLPMTDSESRVREAFAQTIMKNRASLSKRAWTSADRLAFDDLYKRLAAVFRTGGADALDRLVASASKASSQGEGE